MDKKKNSLVVLCVVFIAAILTFFLLSKNNNKITINSVSVQKPPEICEQFKKREVAGEISCKDAIDKTLSLYSGTVTDIVMANNLKKASPEKTNQQSIQAWRIAILLNQPHAENGETMTHIRITLDRENGNVFSQYFFK